MIKKLLHSSLLYFFQAEPGQRLFFKLRKYLYHLPIGPVNRFLFQLYSKQLSQGLTNYEILSYNFHNRIWPYWIHQQLNPSSPSFSSPGYSHAIVNQSHRNWTSLSYPGLDEGGIIDERGLITPSAGNWSLDVWVSINSKLYSACILKKVTQEISDTSLTVHTTSKFGPIKCISSVFFRVVNSRPIIFQETSLTNTSKDPVDFSFYYAIRPYNPEGVSIVESLLYLSSGCFMVNNKMGVIFDQKPDNVICSSFKDGDVKVVIHKWEKIFKANCPDLLASGLAEYACSLDGFKEVSYRCQLPLSSDLPPLSLLTSKSKYHQKVNRSIFDLNQLNHSKEFNDHQADWQSIMTPLCQLTVPDSKIQLIFNQSLYHVTNMIGSTTIYKGFSHSHFDFHYAFSLITTLIKMGHFDFAKTHIQSLPLLKGYLKHTEKDLCGSAYLGQSLLLISLYYTYTLDDAFLTTFSSQISAIIKKISHSKTTASQGSPLSGLLKASYAYNNEGVLDTYFWDNFWVLSGLNAILKCAKNADSCLSIDHIEALSQSLKHSINDLFDYLMTQSECGHIPISNQRSIDSGLISSLCCIYPCSLIDANHSFVTKTLSLITDYFCKDDIFFNQSGHRGYSPYENCILAQVYLARQDKKAFKIIGWLNSTSSSMGCWPESIHPVTLGGSFGDGFDGLASGEYIQLIRNMLIQEQETELLLLPMIPKEWLQLNQRPLIINQFPTRFGMVSFTVNVLDSNRIVIYFSNDFKHHPLKIKVSCPIYIEKVIIGVQDRSVQDYFVKIPSRTTKLELIVNHDF